MRKMIVAAVAAVALAAAGCGQEPDTRTCRDAERAEVLLDRARPQFETRNYGEDTERGSNVVAELIDDAREEGANEGCPGYDDDEGDAE